MIPSIRRLLVMLLAAPALGIPTVAPAQADSAPAGQDPVAQLVARLDLEQYKATIKGLTQFGDRRQGTDRNRAAVNWIEAQLRSYGCADVARLKYVYQPPPPRTRTEGAGPARDSSRASGGGRYRGVRARTGVNNDSLRQPEAGCVRSTRQPARRARATRCTAPRSAASIPARCTSWAPTWTGSAGVKRRTTTAQAPRSSCSSPASSLGPPSGPFGPSGLFSGTTRRRVSTGPARTSSSVRRCRARRTRRARASTPSPPGSA